MIEIVTMETGERYQIIERKSILPKRNSRQSNFEFDPSTDLSYIKIKRILRPRFIRAGFKGTEYWTKEEDFLEQVLECKLEDENK